ncbi:unnamed protein product [Amaranthus hypochondriacus]
MCFECMGYAGFLFSFWFLTALAEIDASVYGLPMMLLWPAIAEGLLLFCWLDAASMIPAWVVCAAVVLMQLLSC